VNAWKITLPLAVACVFAGLVVGGMTITLVSSESVNCGSGLGGGSGTSDANAEAACAPILSERNAWAITLIFIGLALGASTGLLRRGATEPMFGWRWSWNRDRAPRFQSPYPGYRQQPDGTWVRDTPPPPGYGGPPPTSPPHPSQ
jgi:hypothetical protein